MYSPSPNYDIMHFAPTNWDKNIECGEIAVSKGSLEFEEVEADLLRAIGNAKSLINLTRIQNVYDFGQFLMRSQIVVISANNNALYKVRRYVCLPNNLRSEALKHNLDHRRLSRSELAYLSHLDRIGRDDLVFVVKILSHSITDRCIRPQYFTDYYIEYVAQIEIN